MVVCVREKLIAGSLTDFLHIFCFIVYRKALSASERGSRRMILRDQPGHVSLFFLYIKSILKYFIQKMGIPAHA